MTFSLNCRVFYCKGTKHISPPSPLTRCLNAMHECREQKTQLVSREITVQLTHTFSHPPLVRVCHVLEVQSVQKVIKCSPWLTQPPRSHESIQTQWFAWSLAGQLSSSLDGAAGLSCANSAGLDVQEGRWLWGGVCLWMKEILASISRVLEVT